MSPFFIGEFGMGREAIKIGKRKKDTREEILTRIIDKLIKSLKEK